MTTIDSNDTSEELVILTKEKEVAELLSEMRHGSLPNSPVPEGPPSSAFISRVSQLPVINSTIKTLGEVYESGKNTSQLLKYSAETVENSVKNIIATTRPMLSRLEPGLGHLDAFACNQLDRIERYSSASFNGAAEVSDQVPGSQSEPGPLSGWNDFLGQESLKSLQFCVEWLRYASGHIDSQIAVLRKAIADWVTHSSTERSDGAVYTNSLLHRLLTLAASVKREVVETMRKVVDIMGKYAGKALPQEARNLVRGFILSLPARWQAVQCQVDPMPSSSTAEVNRVLSLAEESSSIIKKTLTVFGDDRLKRE